MNIEKNEVYFFAEIWNGEGNGLEILESRCICIGSKNNMPIIVDFKILSYDGDVLETVIEITEIR